MFDELVKQIVHLIGLQTTVIVAISGFGGSGKLHLADQLRDYFKLKISLV